MEPRTHARGNEKRFDPPEAKAQLQWSHALTRVETNARTGPIFQSGVLQWSHALTRVETANVTFERMRFELASMEPRTHARGNVSVSSPPCRSAVSFNGATHSRAWKLANEADQRLAAALLQWSHALTRVETRMVSTFVCG